MVTKKAIHAFVLGISLLFSLVTAETIVLQNGLNGYKGTSIAGINSNVYPPVKFNSETIEFYYVYCS